MTQSDPRHKNQILDGSIRQMMDSYVMMIQEGLRAISEDKLEMAVNWIEETAKSGGTVYVAGNGGSAAIGDHLCCDWTKGTHHHAHPVIRTQSFTSNSALLTALSNDFGYGVVFSKQAEYFLKSNDILIAISSSGNSDNIVAALEVAKSRSVRSIGLSGFSGGRLNTNADLSLYVPVNNYGAVEDAHQIIMHTIAQRISRRRDFGN